VNGFAMLLKLHKQTGSRLNHNPAHPIFYFAGGVLLPLVANGCAGMQSIFHVSNGLWLANGRYTLVLVSVQLFTLSLWLNVKWLFNWHKIVCGFVVCKSCAI
jgi:hypothetical protein